MFLCDIEQPYQAAAKARVRPSPHIGCRAVRTQRKQHRYNVCLAARRTAIKFSTITRHLQECVFHQQHYSVLCVHYYLLHSSTLFEGNQMRDAPR